MKNAEIIKALPKLKALHRERKSQQGSIKLLEAQLTGMRKQLTQLEYEIETVESVTEVFEGVALHVNDKDYNEGPALDVHAADRARHRYAEVYPNAHTHGKDWGLKFRQYGQGSGGGAEDWRGSDWGFDDAVLAAKRWAAHGEKPTDAWEIMHKLRHKLDPKRKAPKRRVLAFEAAFTAGHRELACELLVGETKLTKLKRATLNAMLTATKAA